MKVPCRTRPRVGLGHAAGRKSVSSALTIRAVRAGARPAPRAGQVVEVLALVAHGGVHRRDLGDLADELAERRPHLLGVQPAGVGAG